MWDDIIGHRDNIAILKTMIATDRIPHALLFTGSEGVGKTLVAQTLAAELLQAPIARNPDYILVAPSPEGTSIKIDGIRALQHQALLTPYKGERRVCIMEEAQRMTEQAANSLLKLLEEPPSHMVFILVASTEAPLLTTIVSRCRIFRFQPLSRELLAQALKVRGFTPAQADLAARLSEGRLGRALTLLATDGLVLREDVLALVANLATAGMEAVWDTAGVLDKLEDDQVIQWRRFLIFVLRDLMVIRVSSERQRLLFNCDQADRLEAMARLWDEGQLQAALTAVRKAERALAANANKHLTYEALLIQLRDLARGEENANAHSSGHTF